MSKVKFLVTLTAILIQFNIGNRCKLYLLYVLKKAFPCNTNQFLTLSISTQNSEKQNQLGFNSPPLYRSSSMVSPYMFIPPHIF